MDSLGGKRLQCQNLRMLVSVFPDGKRNVSKHLLSRHLRICRTWFISILWGSFLALFPTLPSVIFIDRGICPKPPGGRGDDMAVIFRCEWCVMSTRVYGETLRKLGRQQELLRPWQIPQIHNLGKILKLNAKRNSEEVMPKHLSVTIRLAKTFLRGC